MSRFASGPLADVARDVAHFVFGADRLFPPRDVGIGPPVLDSVNPLDVIDHVRKGAIEARGARVYRAAVAAEALLKSYYGDRLPTDDEDFGIAV
jgi:hypothetical protein